MGVVQKKGLLAMAAKELQRFGLHPIRNVDTFFRRRASPHSIVMVIVHNGELRAPTVNAGSPSSLIGAIVPIE